MRRAIELRRSLRRMLLRTVVALLLLAGLVMAPSLAAASGWVTRDPSGLGLILPGRLWVSGAVTVAGEVPEHEPNAIGIDDASLLARWEPLSRLSLFTELRLDDPVEASQGEALHTSLDLLVERLYLEALLT